MYRKNEEPIPMLFTVYQILTSSAFVITATEIKNIDATEIKDRNDVDRIARLLSVDSNKLYKGLTSKTIYTREDAVTSSLSRDASLDVRDAFVKVKR